MIPDLTLADVPDHIRRRLLKPEHAGLRVAVRLNLNCKIDGVHIQTVHSPARPSGAVLGYGSAVSLRGVSFYVNQAARASIAAGLSHKYPMAAVVGELTFDAPLLEGVPARFNPKIDEHFVTVESGLRVISADEATIFSHRVYLRGHIVLAQ